MKCGECGNEIENLHFCPYCGTEQERTEENLEAVSESDDKAASAKPSEQQAVEPSPQSSGVSSEMSRGKKVLLANCAICVVLVALIGVGLWTGERWEKVDLPGHDETFHPEEYKTGRWHVWMDGTNPCYIGQSWVDCVNAHVAEYNNNCANRSLADNDGYINHQKGGTEIRASSNLCSAYSDMISRMKEHSYGYVSSLGSWGYLHSEAEVSYRQVSNNDYIAPKTHTALCVFGFIGECDFENRLE